MKPIEAFKRAIFYVSGLCSQRALNKPGAVIERLSTDARDALKELKASDIDGSQERLDDLKYYVGSDQYYQNKEFEKERLEFDKKIAKEILTPKKY
jgi:hypothetical protein